jgi:hypothetical protein
MIDSLYRLSYNLSMFESGTRKPRSKKVHRMSPTVLRVNGVNMMIYTADHKPPHIHAFIGDHEAKIEINSLKVENKTMNKNEIKRAVEAVRENQKQLKKEWKKIHG